MPTFCPNCGVSIGEKTKYCPECGADIVSFITKTEPSANGSVTASSNDITFKLSKMHPLAIVVCVVYILWAIVDTVSNHPFVYAIFDLLFIFGIGYLLGEYAAKNWAPKINGSQSWAFGLPFTLNLIGFACYWFFYKYNLEGKARFLVGFLVFSLIIVLLVFFFMYAISIPAHNGLQTTTIHESNLSTAELSGRILQQPSEIPSDYTIVEWRVNDASDVSQFARSVGWKKGFTVRYQQIGLNASYGSFIQQTISVYPIENVTMVLPNFRYYQKLVTENNDSFMVDGLPDPGIGDSSTATRFSAIYNNSHTYFVDFVKNDVHEQIMMGGPTSDYETVKNLAKIAAAKIT
ncbi:zinc-ribbon domain-containing protein [Methanoregula sp.]|jgi:hypothetical protein|uniref:zinc ribbon domain-containing protein n=1 Tax=Methanoregula sp. TaxID=2052170 RepID=UPI003C166560